MKIGKNRQKVFATTVCAAAALAGCGGGDTARDETIEPADAAARTASSAAFITGTASGAVDSEFALNGVFKCERSGLGDGEVTAEIIGTGDQGEQLSIFLPYSDETGPGTYDLIGTDDDRMQITGRMDMRYRAPDRTTFDKGTGSVTITEWPTGPSEPARGRFSGSLSSDDGETVEVEGTIDGASLREFECLG